MMKNAWRSEDYRPEGRPEDHALRRSAGASAGAAGRREQGLASDAGRGIFHRGWGWEGYGGRHDNRRPRRPLPGYRAYGRDFLRSPFFHERSLCSGGTIRETLVENETSVEYGQPLFAIELDS